MTMRSILFTFIVLLASTAVVHASQAQRPRYEQALNSHQQPTRVIQEELNGVDQAQPDEDALTRRIERDSKRLDRLIEICGGC